MDRVIAPGPTDRKVFKRRVVFVAISPVMVAYIALVLFGGRIPDRFLLLPFLPIYLLLLQELVWQARYASISRERRPAWMRLTGVVAYLLCLAIAASLVVRYYLP